ncbi:MAG TPA: ABC transporter substrate-binding protein [Gaiellaceae bacterium]|nr:ABC transporter substrate-binding protein [Gaiellaceae bacterium]
MRLTATLALGATLATLAAGCGGTKSASTTSTTASAASCAKGSLKLVTPGVLTVGTGNPAYPPWYGGKPHSPWQVSDPRSGKGYESAVLYATAKQLGFTHAQVKWIYVPFNNTFAPGPKKFDVAVQQISYEPARAKAVDFTYSYYNVNQSVVVNNGTKIASVDSIAGLKPFKLGAELGTTSYNTIVSVVKPDKKPAVYDTNDAAVEALKNKQIDGLVVDLPTAFYVTSAQVPNSKVLGQFPAPPGGEHFGMVLAKGSSLTHCFNQAIGTLRSNGTLDRLQAQWLAKAAGAPVLK